MVTSLDEGQGQATHLRALGGTTLPTVDELVPDVRPLLPPAQYVTPAPRPGWDHAGPAISRPTATGPAEVSMPARASVPSINDLKAAIAKHPRLTYLGFRPTKDIGTEGFIADREAMTSQSSLEEFKTAVAWLRFIRRTKGFSYGSYYLKHCAECWGRAHGRRSYISNGMLIAAAIHEKVAMSEPTEDSQNVMLGLHAVDVKRSASRYGAT